MVVEGGSYTSNGVGSLASTTYAGDAQNDARHWNRFLLTILEEHADVFESLFISAS